MLLTALSWFYALAALGSRFTCLQQLRQLFLWVHRPVGYRRTEPKPGRSARSRAKPEWVKKELLRLKALMIEAGCRVIADTFNRLYASLGMTVGKTFVSNLVRDHKYAIEVLRRKIKSARPRPVPRNLVWGLDLTGKTDLDARTHVVLGIVEHASRAALWLEALPRKSSCTLLLRVVAAVKRYGKPGILRTDNESVFTSKAFRLALFLLGIRHQRTEQAAPWQNGRIERFFGTLKAKLDRLTVDSFRALNEALGEFRFFYNHVRPHQNLCGLTPAEAWAADDPFTRSVKKVYWFEAWEGLLRGYYVRS